MVRYVSPSNATFLGKIDFSQTDGITVIRIHIANVGNNIIMGGITGWAGGQLGNYLQKPLTSLYGNISSPVLKEMLMQGSVGIGTGFTLNTAMAKINGASWDDAFSAGIDGATWGLVTGLSSGAVKGFRYARENKISPFSGKDDATIQAEKLAKKYNLYTEQRGGAHKDKVTEDFYQKMVDKDFRMTPEEVAGGYEYRGKIQITEGVHRVAASLKYQVITGDNTYIKYMLSPGTGRNSFNTKYSGKLFKFKIK